MLALPFLLPLAYCSPQCRGGKVTNPCGDSTGQGRDAASGRMDHRAEGRNTLASFVGGDGHVYIGNVTSGDLQGHFWGGDVLPFVCPRAETMSSLGSQAYSESPIVSGQLHRILCSGFPLDPSLWPCGFLPSRCGTPGQSPTSTHLWTSLPGPVHSRHVYSSHVASASSWVRQGRSWAGGAVKMSGMCSSDHPGAPGLWSLIQPGNSRT